MPGLLVSVRSTEEARAAVAGGAAVIDVKEPSRGPLGRSDVSVWRAIVAVVPASIPVSVALGELNEFAIGLAFASTSFDGIAYRKLGLANSGPDWRRSWNDFRAAQGPGPDWVAVVYADWERARSPEPDAVLDAALESKDCTAVLVDTWDKLSPSPLGPAWKSWVERAQRHGLTVVLAGGLDERKIRELAPLAPDFFAVRGSACHRGEREGTIDAGRVSRLAQAAAALSGRPRASRS